MELLIAAGIGALGWTISHRQPQQLSATQLARQSGAKDFAVAVDRPAEYPFKSVPNSVAALKEHERLSQQRWESARSAPATGVISGGLYRMDTMGQWNNHNGLGASPSPTATPTLAPTMMPTGAPSSATGTPIPSNWPDSVSPTPFFSSFAKQHTNDAVKQRRMELASGTDTTFWHSKKEMPALFNPTMQNVTSSGSSGNAPNYEEDRKMAAVSGLQNNVLPFQQMRVGPGLGLKDINTPASDGFHPQFRVLPPDAYSYKTNTLEGRIIPGASQISARTVDPKVVSKGIPRFYDMERRPMEKGRATVTAQAIRPEVVRTGGCYNTSEDYYGIAGASGPNVQAGAWARNRTDNNQGLPLTNATGARAGVGGYSEASYDDARFVNQQRETTNEPGAGFLTGDQKRYPATSNYLVDATQRSMSAQGYGGGAGHYVPSGTIHQGDSARATLREQLLGASTGPGIAAAVTKGATIQCTDKQLLKEAKRGSQVVNTYVAAPERTDQFRRANLGDDLLSERYGCGIKVSVKNDANQNRVTDHAGSQAAYTYQATLGTDTGTGPKLPEVNRFQDYDIAKTVLRGNDLLPSSMAAENVNVAFMR